MILAFDADDTLWHNEIYYREAEEKFASLMLKYCDNRDEIVDYLLKVEQRNLSLLGYGSKAFIISLVESALELSKQKVLIEEIEQIIEIGKETLSRDIVLFPNVERVLQELHSRYQLVLATKGDLKDQQVKIEKSGLERYFSHIEILSEKDCPNYKKMVSKLNTTAENITDRKSVV